MNLIEINLFDTPGVKKNKKPIIFPFRKAEALLYYLVVNRQATRDELVHLFWGELDDVTAKKNLRNALYKIRQAFEEEILISPQKSIIILNPGIHIACDVYEFNKGGPGALASYQGPFLKGFFLRDGEAFEEWVVSKREYYRDTFVKCIYKELQEARNNHWEEKIDEYAHRIIEADEFDERAYRFLMEYYREKGLYNKGIALFEKLKDILDRELGIKPEEQTTMLYKNILTKRNKPYFSQLKSSDSFFYGRQREMDFLEEHLKAFYEKGESKALIIFGEAGIGKTKLKEVFVEKVDTSQVFLMEANCYQAEVDYPLKPWNPILSRLADIIREEEIEIPEAWQKTITSLFPSFSLSYPDQTLFSPEDKETGFLYRAVMEVMIGIMLMVSRKGKTIIIFEDIQWMDAMSWALLKSIILTSIKSDVLLIATCREGYGEKIDPWFIPLVKENKLTRIILTRFTENETGEFIIRALPKIKLSQEQMQNIYKETEGNAFFLSEYINNIRIKGSPNSMSEKIQDVLKSRFLDISPGGIKLLNLISLFFHRVSIDLLAEISGKQTLELFDLIEELQGKCIIREISEHEKISVEFTHLKLREFIYLNQSAARRRHLHYKIALLLENSLNLDYRDMLVYSTLVYHFTKGGVPLLALKYSMKNLNAYLDFYHELFPVVIDFPHKVVNASGIMGGQVLDFFGEIERLMDEIRDFPETEEYIRLKMAYLHLKARYLIREGSYETGIPLISELISLAEETDDNDFLLKGYRQMIYYSIQTHQTQEMGKYVNLSKERALEKGAINLSGILLRFQGLYHLMMGQYDEAEACFWESIDSYCENNTLSRNFNMNIAACYNYLGEVKRYQREYAKALVYYQKAIAFCERFSMPVSFSFFNTCAGQAAFDLGDNQCAFEYFNKALKYYREYDVVWHRSIAEAYMSLLLVMKKDYLQALRHLVTAEEYGIKIKSPYEMGILFRVKAEIRLMMEEEVELYDIFHEKLSQQVDYYSVKGLEYLNKVLYCYEIDILKGLIEKAT
ncbi:MAG: hypothetical protein JM58_19195 [Peptococcaceae bacterium BICA1-8]|nr:MAG: hypothetical protein JM58_19195 [Peptococcaceae bacterium BICA1-8]